MGAETVMPLKLRCVWRGHLYLSADARMPAPPFFSITAITQSLYQPIMTGGKRGDHLKLEMCNSW